MVARSRRMVGKAEVIANMWVKRSYPWLVGC